MKDHIRTGYAVLAFAGFVLFCVGFALGRGDALVAGLTAMGVGWFALEAGEY